MSKEHPYYRAYCKKCGCTVKTGEEDTFLDPFFLPQRCPRCSEYHSKHAYSSWSDDCLYQIEYGFWRFVPDIEQKPKVWFLPWTWGPSGTEEWVLWSDRLSPPRSG